MIALAQPDNLIEFPDVAPQGKSNEWYTPQRYVDAARKVMGSIDLDPASCYEANQVVKAKRYYTKQENGLAQEWKAKTVWLNPPYGKVNGKGNMVSWIKKLIEEYEQGNVRESILLSTAVTDMSWFHMLWSYPICFCGHKIWFHRPNERKQAQWHGSIFVYLGSNEQKFIEVFSQFGRIAKAIDTPKVQPINLSLWEVQS